MLRSLGRSRGSGRSGLGRSSAVATSGTSDFATDFAALAALVAATENALKQFDHRTAVQLVALRSFAFLLASGFASNLLASLHWAASVAGFFAGADFAALLHFAGLLASRFASNNLLASLDRAASGLGAAAFGRATSATLTNRALALEQVFQTCEQVAYRGSAALLALATIGGTGWFACLRASCFTGLRASFFTTGDLGASFALAAATAVQPEHAIQEFKAEPLAAQGYAHQERSKNRLGSH